MRRNNATHPKAASPYRSGQAQKYTVHENKFVIEEPRLKVALGEVYDKTLQANTVPKTTLRDTVTGAFVTNTIAFVIAWSQNSWIVLPDLVGYVVVDIFLLIAAAFLWVKHITKWLNAKNDQTTRSRIVSDVFNSIVKISTSNSDVQKPQ